jgi:hypothetical protein
VVGIVVDGPAVESVAPIIAAGQIDLDPFTADLDDPIYTPFFAVLESIPGYNANGTNYLNTYEITARSQQFAHFTPGSLLANDQTHQPADPLALTKARNAEEAKGSWLQKVWGNVQAAGRWAWQHRSELAGAALSVF